MDASAQRRLLRLVRIVYRGDCDRDFVHSSGAAQQSLTGSVLAFAVGAHTKDPGGSSHWKMFSYTPVLFPTHLACCVPPLWPGLLSFFGLFPLLLLCS